MREEQIRSVIELEVTNPITGDRFTTHGEQLNTSTYYSIRNITSRINAMDLLTKMAETCKSPKDITILNQLLDTADKYNTIRIDNIAAKAKEYDVARSKLNALLKAFEDVELFRKLDKGIYLVNPFVFMGRRVKSNELREAAQLSW